jgi:hypothetical protein
MLVAMRRPLISIVAALAVAGSLTSAASSQALIVGLADQQATSFADARLTALPISHARLSVAWDAMNYSWQIEQIDDWMASARAAGMTVLVTFGRSRTKPYSLPRTREYKRLTLRFLRHYRDVREYSPWNEPNLAKRPANANPRRISTYYRTLRSLCPRCTVLGAEVVDNSRLESWMRDYLRVFPPGRAPRLWGLHNYVDVNSTSRWGTRTMLRLAPGQIWFTETGAIIHRRTPSAARRTEWRINIRTGERYAARATKRIFTLARMDPRIARAYVYHWRGDADNRDWDSALLTPAGKPRPGFAVFARQAMLAARAAAKQGEPVVAR